VTVDFSPLRTLEYGSVKEACLAEARDGGYPSLVGVADHSIEALGWEIQEKDVVDAAIWRVPVYSVTATFATRADSRRYAVRVAHAIANGPLPDYKGVQPEDDEDVLSQASVST
jgi:hypothetical protein